MLGSERMNTDALLERIFINSNDAIFHLNSLPWENDKIIENVITALKRRIDINGFQTLIPYSDLDSLEMEAANLLLKDGKIIKVGDSGRLVITEYGMIFLNYSKTHCDHIEIITKSQKKLVETININLYKRCESISLNQVSNKEAVLGLFLLLNGAINDKNKMKLIPSENGGYLYGESIIQEINNIYSDLLNDEDQVLIKDNKEFRNIVGRIGRNGRFAKVFPQYYKRNSDAMWFDLSTCENFLYAYKSIMEILIGALLPRAHKQQIIQNLQLVIEKYMINNPLEPYVIKEIFNNPNNFEVLLNMHVATKNLFLDNGDENTN